MSTPALRLNGVQYGTLGACPIPLGSAGEWWDGNVLGPLWRKADGSDIRISTAFDEPIAAPLPIGANNATWAAVGTQTHPIMLGVNIVPIFGLDVQGGSARIRTINQPSSVTVTPIGGTGATSWAYYVVAVDAAGNRTQASSTISIANGNATLGAAIYNTIAWLPSPGAVGYDIIRSTAGGTPSTTGCIAFNLPGLSINDTGLTASTYTTPSGNATGDLIVDGNAKIASVLSGTAGGITIGGGNNIVQGNLSMQAGIQIKRATVADANTTIGGNPVTAWTTLTASRVATLSVIGTSAQPFICILKDESGNAAAGVTITGTPASGLIDGAASKVLINSAFGFARLYCNGTNWFTW